MGKTNHVTLLNAYYILNRTKLLNDRFILLLELITLICSRIHCNICNPPYEVLQLTISTSTLEETCPIKGTFVANRSFEITIKNQEYTPKSLRMAPTLVCTIIFNEGHFGNEWITPKRLLF
jgi:hypothetical protein